MTACWFVDDSVLLHAVDDKDATKRDQARAWLRVCWERRCGRTSVPVLNSFYASACKRFTSLVARGDARAEVRRYQHWRPWVVDHQTVESAWAIEARYGLSYADSLTVAAAQQQGCTHLLSEDLPIDMKIDSVHIINPFNTSPDDLLGTSP